MSEKKLKLRPEAGAAGGVPWPSNGRRAAQQVETENWDRRHGCAAGQWTLIDDVTGRPAHLSPLRKHKCLHGPANDVFACSRLQTPAPVYIPKTSPNQ
jgi:hypothetical protein